MTAEAEVFMHIISYAINAGLFFMMGFGLCNLAWERGVFKK
jgi:hypothetical protein